MRLLVQVALGCGAQTALSLSPTDEQLAASNVSNWMLLFSAVDACVLSYSAT